MEEVPFYLLRGDGKKKQEFRLVVDTPCDMALVRTFTYPTHTDIVLETAEFQYSKTGELDANGESVLKGIKHQQRVLRVTAAEEELQKPKSVKQQKEEQQLEKKKLQDQQMRLKQRMDKEQKKLCEQKKLLERKKIQSQRQLKEQRRVQEKLQLRRHELKQEPQPGQQQRSQQQQGQHRDIYQSQKPQQKGQEKQLRYQPQLPLSIKQSRYEQKLLAQEELQEVRQLRLQQQRQEIRQRRINELSDPWGTQPSQGQYQHECLYKPKKQTQPREKLPDAAAEEGQCEYLRNLLKQQQQLRLQQQQQQQRPQQQQQQRPQQQQQRRQQPQQQQISVSDSEVYSLSSCGTTDVSQSSSQSS